MVLYFYNCSLKRGVIGAPRNGAFFDVRRYNIYKGIYPKLKNIKMFNEETKERIVNLFGSLKESKKQHTAFEELSYLQVKSDTSKNAYNIGKFKSVIAKEINSTAREVQEFLVQKKLVSVRKKKKAPKAKKVKNVVKYMPPTYTAYEGSIVEVVPGIFDIRFITNDPEKKGEYKHHRFFMPKELFTVIK